ncbi:PLD nuclease N-terminal domain-containing protein [Streptomyces sp. NPDC088337]|uniref:PLD nuclease N-terminal domain-containing protein n=1 Tax=unclassified Streptomyces TaxID=2593676 RepID=UPI002DDA831A|nr:PLD nuclease N-terminal domain-containing protein [Streptomyces sp. NBC_01788]WSB27390.1 PLD nuclease N-terminal domain-containing protein [Streptomyces sp. NBC_01788]
MLASTLHASDIPWAAIAPLLVAELALLVYCLVDVARNRNTRHLPRWAWVLICLCVNPLGPIAYLVAGRSENR